MAGYNFATVVDDRDMGITHVIRGDDHLTNTARQQLLFEALGGPVPRWAHHSMVLGPDGGKLSKRHGATAVGDYRDLGYLPEAIVNYLALLGWSHGEDEVLELDRLVREFDLGRLSPSPAVFDLAKLDWLDHERIMALAPEEHERRFAERLPAGTPPQAAAALAAAFQPSLVRYGDAAAAAAEVLAPPPAAAGAARRRARRRAPARARPHAARRGAGVARARRRPRPPRRLPRLGQGAGHRRPRPAHAAAHRAHVGRARPRAAVRARRARARHRPRATRPHSRRERCR